MTFGKLSGKLGGKLGCLTAGLLLSGASAAADFSFQGTFERDDDVQIFSFNVGAASNVTLRSLGYAGGVNAAGETIERGGFDTILALFNDSGLLIDSNDDGGPGNVAADAGTGESWDSFLQAFLAPGYYQVSVMQYDNFALGPNLSDGFLYDGAGNFTAPYCGGTSFCDVSGVVPWNQRNNRWAFDVLDVESATVSAIPEPGTYAMLLGGLGLLGFAARRRKSATPA